MIYAVANVNTKEIVYTVKNNCHNACVERDRLNAIFPMIDQPFIVISGKRNIQNFKNS